MNSKKKRNQKKSANHETLTLVPQSVKFVERSRFKRKEGEEGKGIISKISNQTKRKHESGSTEPKPQIPFSGEQAKRKERRYKRKSEGEEEKEP